jgi:putative ABC transport system ATP-binding protein
MSLVVTQDLSKQYGTGQESVAAIRDINVHIEAGEFVSIMGESGAGKSTLLSVMGAMNAPTSGSYLIDDIDVYGLSLEQQADLRREYLGFVFQSFHLVPYLTLIENVMLPLTTVKRSRGQKRARAMEALESVGLASKARRLPGQISGGEKERAAIARAVVNAPPILLADEPTGNLDTKNSLEVMQLLLGLKKTGITIIMVTHSDTCAGHADRIIRMDDGRLA